MEEKSNGYVIHMTVPTFILALVLLTIVGISIGITLFSVFGNQERMYIAHYHGGNLGYPSSDQFVLPSNQSVDKGNKKR